MRAREKKPEPFVTVVEAAGILAARTKARGFSPRTIRRLIRAGELRGIRQLRGGRRHLLIPVSELERLARRRLIDRISVLADTGFTMPTDSSRPTDPFFGMPDYYVFKPAGGEVPESSPNFDLKVTVAELHRYAFKRVASNEEYEALRVELSARLTGKPVAFAVRFHLDPEETEEYLAKLAGRLQLPRIAAAQAEQIRSEVITHLMMIVLPRLREMLEPEAYLLRSAKNFLRERLRQEASRRRREAKVRAEAIAFDRLP